MATAVGSLTNTFSMSSVCMPDQGISVFLNGTDAQATVIREDGVGTDIEAYDFDHESA